MDNPYTTHKGFGLRVSRAETAIKKLAVDRFSDIHTREFESCFEMGDGDAVVFALMQKAYVEPDQNGQSLLTDGIRTMFSRNLNENGFPQSWEDIVKQTKHPSLF